MRLRTAPFDTSLSADTQPLLARDGKAPFFRRMSCVGVRSVGLGVLFVLLAGSVSAVETSCQASNREAFHTGVSVPGCDAGRVVVGAGRLQFYSAPNLSCKMPGTFIIPGDSAVAYVEKNGFTSVMYINLKTKEDAMGWVSSSRLKRTGTGISPCN